MSDRVRLFKVLANLVKLKRIKFIKRGDFIVASIDDAYNLDKLIKSIGWGPMFDDDKLTDYDIESEKSESSLFFKYQKEGTDAEVCLNVDFVSRKVDISVD